MTDLVIIAFLGEPLALSREQVDEARLRARSLFPANIQSSVAAAHVPTLIDSERLAEMTSLPQTWLEEQARRGTIPSLELGKYRRFELPEALAALRNIGRRQ